MKIIFYHDPGHGWYAVKRATLIELGIESLITNCSYQRGGTVYLEEDCDATTFFDAAQRNGIKVEVKRDSYADRSPVRSYENFKSIFQELTIV